MDKLNSISYAYHYRNLDSAEVYARRAYALSGDYGDGKAEAINNLAFVSIMRMDYDKAHKMLSETVAYTDNQVELLVSDVLQMRICQRISHNREFYDYREHATNRLRRINEERGMLSKRMCKRLIYAETEYAIVSSAYYYYVGLERQSVRALGAIESNDDIRKDTAQYLNYLYNVGAGGIVKGETSEEISLKEFEYLLTCYLLASQQNYIFFEANSLEAMAEHLEKTDERVFLLHEYDKYKALINPYGVEDNMLAGNLAETALSLFRSYGDVYQTAGAYRTLASCYMAIGDYHTALSCLKSALSNAKTDKAPDLVASIREQLSVAYSAINDKPASDYNRNIYLDLQEQTRQDRYLEARAQMFDRAASQLNIMIVAVVCAILLLIFMLWLFNRLYQKRKRGNYMDELLRPLREWQEQNVLMLGARQERYEELNESYAVCQAHLMDNERRNLENRAKISLVNSVIPFIDRIINELNILMSRTESGPVRDERYVYILELADKIIEYNDVLTHWILLRQGMLSLHIESFPLAPLLELVSKSRTEFAIKNIELSVVSTDAVVKADRILTLFMVNTLTENARKFTPSGGKVAITVTEAEGYVEISVTDTGSGMAESQLAHIFDYKMHDGHGFGLMNCRGIIEKYKKVSQIFRVCCLAAESRMGHGSRFYFRLPRGVVRTVVAIIMSLSALSLPAKRYTASVRPQVSGPEMLAASAFADSAYYSNIAGTYAKTLSFADSCRKYLNAFYLHNHPGGRYKMLQRGNPLLLAPEITWYRDSVHTNYNIILDIRNESAVAALALHDWQLYDYNNKVYTQLFKEMSADNTLADYCRMMQQSQTNKTIAVIILVLLLVMILPAYYLIYYRHRLYYRFCVERIKVINGILLSDMNPTAKLRKIEPLTHEPYPAKLQSVVEKIRQALLDAISMSRRQMVDIELAEDELRRVEYENNNLYVCNSVLDNCLSTLKHETMYYPDRIRQLLTGRDSNLEMMHELVVYYREIYSTLRLQALRQLEHVKLHVTAVDAGELTGKPLAGMYVVGDKNLLKYMFDILRQQPGYSDVGVAVVPEDSNYMVFTVTITGLDSVNRQNPFAQRTANIPFLLCRQIVRDHSEVTGRRRCGIVAREDDGSTKIEITLARHR